MLSGEKESLMNWQYLLLNCFVGSKLSLAKVNVIREMKEVWGMHAEVRRFLGAYLYYHI